MLALRVVVLLFVTTAAAAAVPTVTLQPRGTALRLAVTGDTGKGADAVARGIAALHAAQPLDAIVITGDNFYPCGVSSATDPRWSLVTALTRIGIPVLPVLGNHDLWCGKADPDAQVGVKIPNWTFPARQYTVRSRVADFAFVDTTPLVRGRSRAAASFIHDVLKESSAPWQVVVGHHPVISSGYHGYFPRDEVKRMRDLIPLLRESQVDLILAGHDHHMELIRGRFVHLISGSGSEPIPPLKLRVTTIFPNEIRIERIGFAVAELSETEIRVRFYDQRGKAKSEWITARRRESRSRSRTTSSPSSPRPD